MGKWTEITANGRDVIYFDLQKAFDTVPHKCLIKLLAHYGFALLSWVEDFLSNRKQQIFVNSSKSERMGRLHVIYIHLLVEKSELKDLDRKICFCTMT